MDMILSFREGWVKRIHSVEQISDTPDTTGVPSGSLKGILKTDSFWLRAVPISAGVIVLYIGVLVMLASVFESAYTRILGAFGMLVILPVAAMLVTFLWAYRYTGKEIRVYDDRIECDGETYRYGEANVLQLDDCVRVMGEERRTVIPCRSAEDAEFIASMWQIYLVEEEV